MAERMVKQILISTIELANQVIEASNEAKAFKKECEEVKIKVQNLLELLKKALISSSNLCEFPTRHVITIAETVLHKSLSLIQKCIIHFVLTIIPASSFQNITIWLEESIVDLLWLLNVSIPSNNGEEEEQLGLHLPSFAMNEPILCLIYEQMVFLYSGTLDDSYKAAKFLGSLAKDNPRYAELMIRNGLCSIFFKVLEQGSMKVQAEVACTISLLVASFPESQNMFAQHGVIQLLLSHLVSRKSNNYVLATSSVHGKTPELEDSLYMKAMAAKGNSSICKIITDSKRFLSFEDLLEIEDKEVRYNSVMVLIKITVVADQDSHLRHSAFKSKSPVFKAIVNQIHKLIEENEDTVLLIPYITLTGNLARAFKASDTSMIDQLVKLLDHQDLEVSREAIIALTKFATPNNYLHQEHSKAIAEAGAAMRLIELSSLGCQIRIPALELLIYIVVHVPEKEEVIKVLECASKQQLIRV